MFYVNQPYSSPRTITVTGEGAVSARPNYIELRLEVTTMGEQITQIQQENAEKMNQVINSLLAIGIPKENIQTAAYTIFPRYEFIEGRQVFRGYEVTNGVNVRREDIQQAGNIIDIAVQNGANQVSSLQFKIENPSVYYQEALEEAILDAFSKANTIGKTLQLSVQPQPIEIVENTSSPVRPFEAASLKSVASTPIVPGESTIQASVTVKFQY